MKYEISEVIQPDGYVHIYTDASVAERAGLGICIPTNNGGEPISFSIAVDSAEVTQDRRVVVISEFMAVAEGLEKIPDNYRALIHTDNQEVFIALRQIVTNGEASPHASTLVNDQLVAIEEKCEKLAEIKPLMSNDGKAERNETKRKLMRTAHDAAGVAAQKLAP